MNGPKSLLLFLGHVKIMTPRWDVMQLYSTVSIIIVEFIEFEDTTNVDN